jgi:geranylgeranylglycerol-phosphate geranylgeranyltransferase
VPSLQAYVSPIRKIAGLLYMIRLPNCLMIGFAVVVGELIASATVPVRAAFYGFMVGFFLLAASMVLNDYFDREIDAINEPKRPIPAGIVKPNEAFSFSLALGAIGFWFAANSGIATLIIAIISIIIMISYNSRIKKTGLLGNAFVSTNVAIPFIYGGFAVGSPTWSLGIFSLLAFLSSMGREIVKGIADVSGDTAKGVKSAAVTRGPVQAAKYGSTLFIAAVALSALPVILGLVSYYYIPLVAICDIGFLLTAYSLLTNAGPSNAKRNKKYVLVWMTFGMLAFLIGAI